MSIFIDKQELLTSSDIPKSYWNLFDGTADFSGKDWHFLNSYSNDPALKSPNGNQSMQRKGDWEGLSKNIYLYSGRIYTISEAVFVDKNTSNGHIHIYGNNLGNSKKITNYDSPLPCLKDIANRWVTIHFTFTVPQSDTYYVRFESENDQVNIHWADLMLNEGSVPLNWNYSLNDIKSRLGGNEITNNETNNKIANNENDSMELATQEHIDQATKSKLNSLDSRVSALESSLQDIQSSIQSIQSTLQSSQSSLQSSQSNYPSY